MLTLSSADKASFLRQGAIFTTENSAWLLWGEKSPSSRRSDEPVILSPFFFQTGELEWFSFKNHMEINLHQAKNLFQKNSRHWSWLGPDKKHFIEQFEMIQFGFSEKKITKVVPYTVDKSLVSVGPFEIESFIAHALDVNKGTLYGTWSEKQGHMGVSPETLISQSEEGLFKTMAVAGTTSLSSYEEDPELFFSDPKENDEHQKVVDDIVDQLSPHGEVKVGERGILKTPHLVHLYTPIILHPFKDIKIESLITQLHPTPALGGTPRSEAMSLLKGFNEKMARRYFGAPFAFSSDPSQCECIVAIRSISWGESDAEIFAGCGVVPTSQLDKEWLEVCRKQESIKKIFGAQ